MEPDEIRSRLAEEIARRRKDAGLTQSMLAERLNYSDKSISKWERGEGVPDVYVLAKMAEIFQCSADALLGLSAAPAPAPRRGVSPTKRVMIPALSVLLVWLTTAVAVFVLRLIPLYLPQFWLMFVYALPASFIVLTVFACLWYSAVWRAVFVSGIIWSTTLSLKLSFSMPAFDWLFLVAAILQALTVLWFVMRARVKKGK